MRKPGVFPARIRATVGALLWGLGTALGLVGNWLQWDWLAAKAPYPYPNQIWGDLVPGTAENALTATYLVLGLLTFATWALTGPTRKRSTDSTSYKTLVKVGTALRWLTVGLAAAALVGITALLAVYLSRWWLLFAGWLGQFFATALVLAGALIVPSISGQHRGEERERAKGPLLAVTAAFIVAAVAPIPVEALVNATQVAYSHEGADSSHAGQVAVLEKEPPWGGAGARMTSGDQENWSKLWKGASLPELLPAFGEDSVAVLLQQASLRRPGLVFLEQATGETMASFSPGALAGLGVDTQVDPAFSRLMFTYNDFLLKSGTGKEWVSSQGKRYSSGPPTGYVEQQTATLMQTDGLHALDVTAGTTWFVGDGSGCARRIATASQLPIISPQGTIAMLQVCDEHARAIPWWAYPDELVDTIAPLTATVFGVSATSGDVLWTQELPGFEGWAEESNARYPSSNYRNLPLEWSWGNDDVTVTFDGVTTKLDLNTGEMRQ